MVRALVAAVVLAVVLAGGPASADDRAKRLFDQGRALVEQGKHYEACVLFEKSFELDPAVGTKLNLAECAERDDKPRKAWLLWIEAADEFARSDKAEQEKFARGRADKLAPKLATIVVKVANPRRRGLVIRIGGRDVVPAAEIIERGDPGQVSVTASAPDRKPFSTSATAARGASVEVDIPKLERIAGSKSDPADDEEATPPSRRPWQILAVVAGGVCLISAGSYVYWSRQVSQAEDDVAGLPLDSPERAEIQAVGERAATRANVSLLALAVGTTALGVATVKILLTPKRDSRAVTLIPVITPSVAGASLQLRW